MKKVLSFFVVLMLLCGCKDTVVQKPEKLLDENQMADALYDVSIIEAMRSRNPGENSYNRQYIYKKYNIDSVQFAQNNAYYAADISKYKKIYEKVNARIEKEKKAADSIVAKSGNKSGATPPPPIQNADKPQVQ